MLESAIGGIAVPVFEGIWKAGGYAFNQIKDASQRTVAIEQVLKASAQYAETYQDRHGQIKIMPGLMKEPIPLDSIYTAVKFLDERSLRYFATQDALEQAYRYRGKRSFQADGERHDGISVAKEKQYLMVLGGPGVGKSTFLRKLGLEALKGKDGQLQSEQIPVFIELKTFRSSDIDLKAIIAKEFEICGFPEARSFTGSTLDQGKLLILLDGLDEVPTRNVNHVIEQIENFVTRYSDNTFVASCRTAAYHSSFKRFTDVTIADFDDEQIEQFIRRWFSADLDKDAEVADHYWELLQRSENAAAKELAQTPLLLTFLCLVYDREQTLPSNRSTLYGDALNILLKEWSAQKRLERDPIYEGFHPVLEKELLSEIAYSSFEEDRLFFSTSDITDRIVIFLEDTLDAEHLDSEAVLKAIEKQQGILVERATDTYSFSHLTLQEYLTSLYIVNNQLVQELVSQHLADERWREVFLLVAGLLGRRSHEFLEAIDQQARTYITGQPKICDLVKWAERVTQDSASASKAFEKRAIALSCVSILAYLITNSTDTEANLRFLALIGATGLAFRDKITDALSDVKNIITYSDDVNGACCIIYAYNSGLADGRAFCSAIYDACADDTSTLQSIRSIIKKASNDMPDFILALETASTSDSNIARVIETASKTVTDIYIKDKGYIASAIETAIRTANQMIESQIFAIQDLKDMPNKLRTFIEKIPQINAPIEDFNRYANKLESTWLKAYDLTVDSISLSKEELQRLGNYLYANELLLCCQQSSIGLSRKAWEALEERLLKL